MNQRVRDIMTPNPVGVYSSQTIGDAARVMRDAGVGAVLIVSGDALGGIVTDRDLVVRGLAEGFGPESAVGPLCSSKLVGVDADAEVSEAERLIRDNAIRRLPVIEGGQIVGMLSLGDIATAGDADTSLAAVSRAQANV